MLEAFAHARVLVVDDNEPSALLVHTVLSRAGLETVEVVTDPREALARVEHSRPDLVLLDLHMPHLDGYAILAELRRGAAAVDLPVLVLTADTTREAARRALSLGANDFVTKPLDITEVTLRVRNLLETRNLHSGLRRRQAWVEASARLARELMPGTVGEPLALVAAAAGEVAEVELARANAPGDGGMSPLAAAVLSTGHPVLIDDVKECEIDALPPGGGADLGPAMLVPLTGSQGVLGVLTLARRRGRPPFGDADLEMATGFAGQSALALELAAARADQERMVVLEDRHRIARDLHDHVIQRLFATGLRLQTIAAGTGPGEVAERIGERVADLDDTIVQIRSSIFQLRGAAVTDMRSLRTRLSQVAGDAAVALGTHPTVRFSGPLDSAVPDDLADDVVAAAREALSNAARHSSAKRVELDVSLADGVLAVQVTDDGVGIGTVRPRGGLTYLRERAALHGGAVTVTDGAGGRGTRLTWSARLPVNGRPAP